MLSTKSRHGEIKYQIIETFVSCLKYSTEKKLEV